MCGCLELLGQVCQVACKLFTIEIIIFDFLVVALLLFHVINISWEAKLDDECHDATRTEK